MAATHSTAGYVHKLRLAAHEGEAVSVRSRKSLATDVVSVVGRLFGVLAVLGATIAVGSTLLP